MKAAVLWVFFALAVAFSLTASIARSGGYRDAEVAGNASVNLKTMLAREAYEDAKKVREDECKARCNSKCRKAEDALAMARSTLATMPGPRIADPGAERIANILGVSVAKVALYSPLALALGMELGGFIFLAAGLAPRRREAKTAARGAGKKEGQGETARQRQIGWDASNANAPPWGDGSAVSIGYRMSSLCLLSAGEGSAWADQHDAVDIYRCLQPVTSPEGYSSDGNANGSRISWFRLFCAHLDPVFRSGVASIGCTQAKPLRCSSWYRGFLMPRGRSAAALASRIAPLIWKGIAATSAAPVRRQHASARGSARRGWNSSVVAVHSPAAPRNSHRFQQNNVSVLP